ncbi:uncharacterized protein LOC124278988 [Haliotis rubra]|uniref:uncharacterized protein LOC124278988 n=1 Tax=Haliotis rubra TaxID=36100 RepID=UPI001EE5E1F8|nr:uncharacterized protein LOC124278988 [Haliotis rubra]
MMLAFVAITVLLGALQGADSQPDAESLAGRVREALVLAADSINSADAVERSPDEETSVDPDDIPGDDWDNGGWGNGDVSRDVSGKANGEKTETWSIGNGESIEISQLGDEDSTNDEWWGV